MEDEDLFFSPSFCVTNALWCSGSALCRSWRGNLGTIYQPTATERISAELLRSVWTRIWAENSLGTGRTLNPTRTSLIFYFLLQHICRLINPLMPFMLHKLARHTYTRLDTTRSYSSSWEMLIFNTPGPGASLQPRSNLQLVPFWQLHNLCG